MAEVATDLYRQFASMVRAAQPPIHPALILPVTEKSRATLLSAGWRVPFTFAYDERTNVTWYVYRGDWT